MKESRLWRVLVFFAETPKSAITKKIKVVELHEDFKIVTLQPLKLLTSMLLNCAA